MATNKPATATATATATVAPATYQCSAKQPATGASITAWAMANAGGNLANVAIVPLPSNASAPMPFSKGWGGTGNRARILWALVNGVPTVPGQPNSRTLASLLTFGVKYGQSKNQMLDVCAALNGGYSAANPHWGTPYIALQVVSSK
jgi:hypothetical protein